MVRKLYSYDGAKCSVESCAKPAKENFMCAAHAQRVRRHGNPDYVTPEDQRRTNSRAAQIKSKKAKPSSYVKYFGRHEHRVVAEKMLGRELKTGEIVHHKDGDRRNNHPSNLEVMTQSEHMAEHRRMMKVARRAQADKIIECPKGHPYDSLNTRLNLRGSRVCRACARAAQSAWKAKTKC